MKRKLQILLFACLFTTSLWATKREGTLEVNGWTPPRGTQTYAEIKRVNLNWYMDDNEGTGTPVKSASIKWELGENFVLKQQKYPLNTLQPEVSQLTLKSINLRAEVCEKGASVGFITYFELENVPVKSGEGFSGEIRSFIDWATVFPGISADSAKKWFQNGFTLCNLQITSATFNGVDKLEAKILGSKNEEAFNLKLAEGDKAMDAKDYEKAEDIYDQALQIIPNHPQGVDKLNHARFYLKIIEGDKAFEAKNYELAKQIYGQARELVKNDENALRLVRNKEMKIEAEFSLFYYEKYLKEGDEALAQKDYSKAKSRYQSAATMFPTDNAIQATIAKKIEAIQYEMAKNEYDRLVKEANDAAGRKEFGSAKSKYEEAAKIFPADNNVQQYIQQQINGIAAAVKQDAYTQQMRLGDVALTNKQFQQAIGYYQQALNILPNDATATAAIAESNRQIQMASAYTQLAKDLKQKYDKQLKQTQNDRKTAIEQATKAFDANCEVCNLEFAKYYACVEDYLQDKSENAGAEAAYEVYKDPSAKAKAEISNNCTKPTCNQLEDVLAVGKASSDDLLTTARRKYQFFKKDEKSNQAFQFEAKNFTEKALDKNPQNYTAMAFGANFAEDIIDGMSTVKQVLMADPSNVEALALKRLWEADFTRLVREGLEKGNVKFAQKLIDKKLIAEIVANGTNVWEAAIDNNQGEVLAVLLKEANAQNLQNYLFRAIEKGSKSCVSALLQAGAKADAPNSNGESALTLATRKGNQGIVDVLSQKSMDKSSALLVAVTENQLETAKTLLKNGANTEAKDGKGDNLLMIAMAKKYEALVELLLANGANVNHENYKGESPLNYAASMGDTKMIRRLLEKNATPEPALKVISPENAKTLELLVTELLDIAIQKDNLVWVQLADKYFSHIAELQNDKKVPMILAALEKGNLSIGKILMASGTNFNQLLGGKYLFLEIVEKNKLNWLQELLQVPDMNTNVRTAAKENALHLAAKTDNDDMIALLLPYGIDKDAQDDKGNTPLLTALTLNKKMAAQALAKSGAKIDVFNYRSLQAIHLAVANRDINMVGALIQAGASVNSVGENGLTPLHYAAQNGDMNIARLLMNSGANKALKDSYNRTPAAVAKKYKYKDLAKLLK